MTAFVVKMKQLSKERWVMALRSGTFPQGQNVLARKGHGAEAPFRSLCCLGVQAVIENVPYTVDSINGSCRFDFNGVEKEDLPPQEWFAQLLEYDAETQRLMVKVPDPILLEGLGLAIMRLLAEMNDESTSFTDIADWIEANL